MCRINFKLKIILLSLLTKSETCARVISEYRRYVYSLYNVKQSVLRIPANILPYIGCGVIPAQLKLSCNMSLEL